MKNTVVVVFSLLTLLVSNSVAANSVHEFETKNITGEKISMEQYAGKVLIIVNTASRCGFARQLADLTQLQEDYADKGVVVIGFPSRNFGRQELEENEAIAAYCEENFGVDFQLMTRTDVRGRNQSPLFAYLTSADNPDFTGGIRWNFEKFIVDQEGVLQRRFRSRTSPSDDDFREAIDQLLQ